MMAETSETAPQSNQRILVVDDHRALALLMVRAIARLAPGAEVFAAEDGTKALECAGDLPLDLLITDRVMPDMDGLELVRRLRTSPAGAPGFTILMTAYDFPGLDKLAADLGVDRILIKPFPPEVLREVVGRALAGEAQTSAAPPLDS